ncbi:DUF2505 domain-containing protein [Actinopolyspora mortivallis]|uniref:DUF2505 domain-containing protein n=1 Tax=Actinopolyspora mortivallis TaxID=33906 RepID=A0A2T0GRU3_ACTMO|nr:DUF2505 domain-containing protein [Actinopolyspora mortivallis]PRW61811.1 DUF2505 domain-containing protein [Actinopolyspora mortivallis]
MTRLIEHRSTSSWSAEHVRAALVDPEPLRERLAVLGGDLAELVSHHAGEDGVHVRLRQRIPAPDLPAPLAAVLSRNTVLERSESWRRRDENHVVGEVAALVRGVPASATASLWLRDLPEAERRDPGAANGRSGAVERSEFVLRGELRARLPLVRAGTETLLHRQLSRLVEQECRFTAAWLVRHG